MAHYSDDDLSGSERELIRKACPSLCHCGKDGHAINSINCPVHGSEWQKIDTRPDLDRQPGRQFILLEGSCRHSDANWYRQWAGEAFILKPGQPDEMLQYRMDDILRLCHDGDIDPHTAKVTHWMPAKFPPFPVAPLPFASIGRVK